MGLFADLALTAAKSIGKKIAKDVLFITASIAVGFIEDASKKIMRLRIKSQRLV